MEAKRSVEESKNLGYGKFLDKKYKEIFIPERINLPQKNCKEIVIPSSFEYIKDGWNEGALVQNKEDGSFFVVVPVFSLDADGTLDGINFNEKFGRRIFRNKKFEEDKFSNEEYHEEIDEELTASVEKFGCFLISAFLATQNGKEIVFKKQNEKRPYTYITQFDAIEEVRNYARNIANASGCLPNGAVYDSLYKWLIQSGAKTSEEVNEDSTLWGNYWDSVSSPKEVTPTGSNENWCVCNIYDLAGNCDEWSRESYGSSSVALRGGDYNGFGILWPVSDRRKDYPTNIYSYTSFRSAVYLKAS